ncbi:hypothetical protein PHSY_003128 [Pseudozyma hubeiensis SY62]|uniref:Secreted protein n=1 Tax=Pseudozyma hubeiensis (strain SY62) TaxID=1305764 RepID=R9P2T4_PSEHS|nr:hypothetical protein PHSY_003128 [Pseudozyma hubeiensis SY62]GAC95552.1 hypothetical protein PHSY_003128 [Pseudozyma hubeiensis SY62]
MPELTFPLAVIHRIAAVVALIRAPASGLPSWSDKVGLRYPTPRAAPRLGRDKLKTSHTANKRVGRNYGPNASVSYLPALVCKTPSAARRQPPMRIPSIHASRRILTLRFSPLFVHLLGS